MIRSFKLKIALFSVLFSVLLLLGFGLYCAHVVYAVGLERIDRELRALVDSDIRKSQPPNHWQRLYASLEQLYGNHAGRQFKLKVYRDNHTPLYTSPNWMTMVDETMFPVQGELEPPVEQEKKPQGKRQKQRKPSPPVLGISNPVFATVGNWRAIAVRNPEVSLCLAMDLAPLQAEVSHIWHLFWMALPVALLIMIASGWILATLALRPVNAIATTARKVSALHLDERIHTANADHEFRQLIDIINEMLSRLETSFQQAVRFSADAAHELKTPLTILQGQLEAALQAAADDSDDQRTYKESLDEVQRLKSIIRKLLLLAQADSGRLPLNMEALDFSLMAENLVEDIGILNPDIEVQADIQPGIWIEADEALIGQVIQNLASNAVKFSQGESPIRLELSRKADGIGFTISNRGQTIPAEDRDKIFERFYRTDKAHSRKTDGTGLGLSLAREIAHAHGGTLELIDSSDGRTTFRLILPDTVSGKITEP